MNTTILAYLIISLFLPLALIFKLIRQDTKLVILIAPNACIVAYVINVIGFGGKWWYLKPLLGSQSLTTLPVNLVFYPALGTFFIYLTEHSVINRFLLLIIFVVLTSSFEKILIMVEWLSYCNSWNVYFTYITYLISYGFGYLYFNWLKKQFITIRRSK